MAQSKLMHKTSLKSVLVISINLFSSLLFLGWYIPAYFFIGYFMKIFFGCLGLLLTVSLPLSQVGIADDAQWLLISIMSVSTLVMSLVVLLDKGGLNV